MAVKTDAIYVHLPGLAGERRVRVVRPEGRVARLYVYRHDDLDGGYWIEARLKDLSDKDITAIAEAMAAWSPR